MGTHPIFESDFDCLTEWWNNRNVFHRTGLDRFNMTGGFIWWTMKILTVLIIICNGSPGDRSSWYRSCFAKCTSENCDGVSELPAYSFPLTSLPCPLRCKAKCIESTHEIIKTKWQKQVQFFGKWPFRRIGNCEELASCVFSIGNLVFTIAD